MTLLERTIFFTVLFSVVISVQFVVYKTFRNYLIRKDVDKKAANYLSRTPFLVFIIPFILFFVTRYDMAMLPDWFNKTVIMPFFIFQGATLFIGLYLIAGKIIKFPFVFTHFLLSRFSFFKNKIDNIKQKKKVVQFDESRRKFITAATTVVSGYAFVGASVGAIQKDNYKIEVQTIKIAGLPAEQKGTSIVMISDIHSGPFMDTGLMSNYVNVINDMKPDLIFIPGDMTNSKREEAAPFAKSFRELKAKYGVYATFGNHDYFNDVNYIGDVIKNESGIRLLRNEALLIDVNGKPFNIMGTEDTPDSGGKSNPTISKYITQTIERASALFKEKNIDSSTVPKILLTHKPYVFDDVSDLNFDLMLSGHTHGGQVVFFKLGDINLSIASSVHKYISGLYRNDDKYLYVSRGIGTVGLPIRFNCPPEITKITLV
jgi:uncharacterized protein